MFLPNNNNNMFPVLQVKIWFQNRRSKFKKIVKGHANPNVKQSLNTSGGEDDDDDEDESMSNVGIGEDSPSVAGEQHIDAANAAVEHRLSPAVDVAMSGVQSAPYHQQQLQHAYAMHQQAVYAASPTSAAHNWSTALHLPIADHATQSTMDAMMIKYGMDMQQHHSTMHPSNVLQVRSYCMNILQLPNVLQDYNPYGTMAPPVYHHHHAASTHPSMTCFNGGGATGGY
jgi:hypothetical protein